MPTRKDRITVKPAATPLPKAAADALLVPVFEEDLRGAGGGTARALDAALEGALLGGAKAERFEGKAGQELSVTTLGRLPSRRIVLMGLGRRAGLEAIAQRGYEALRAAAGKAARGAVKAGARAVAVAVPEVSGDEVAPAGRALAEGVLLGAYAFERYKREEGRAPGLEAVTVLVPPGPDRSAALRDALELAGATGRAVRWARDLVNLGPADCTPTLLAEAASVLAREAGLQVEVRGPKEIQALQLGMFLGVTRGSSEPPRLVKVSYVPKGAAARKAPVVLVGKAITFDSGGLSLKPTESMVTMNTDMAGSAAVLGAMQVIATLRPEFPVHAVLGACENMPGGRAYKPSDVLTAFDGTTVEITNTDAEGRLVLGDVLAWAGKTLAPAAMIDVATLTGACMVALGTSTAGVFGPDGKVIDRVLAAARSAGEDVWRLPLTEALEEQLKSDRADLKNTGERWGGAITAAHFLKKFVKDTPWAHLDIAGPSHTPKDRGYEAAGGTGFGIRTLVELVRRWEA